MTVGARPFVIGPLRIATSDVLIHTNCEDFAELARSVFADLAVTPHDLGPDRTVLFETVVHDRRARRWSVRRDGQPCEMHLRDDAVLVHQQWELNRLAIDAHRTSLHAAAVAVDDRGVLLAGPSHSGKTTLAAWMVGRLQAQYVADEVASVDRRLCVRPFPRPLGLRSDGPLTAATSDHDGLVARFMPDERLVPISELGGTRCSSPVPIRLVVFPRYEGASPTSLAQVSEADALERLVALTPGVARYGRPVFERLAQLVATTPVVEVRSSDVGRAAALVLRELSGVGV